jgi:hypothetical protein
MIKTQIKQEYASENYNYLIFLSPCVKTLI